MKLLILLLFPLLTIVAFAQASGIRTYCNPMDMDYKYGWEQINDKISYRSAADPVIVAAANSPRVDDAVRARSSRVSPASGVSTPSAPVHVP